MSKELDNLFRKKLDGYKAEPTPAAWEKVESSLHPDRLSWKFYVSIAASLALIAIISIYVFMPKSDAEELGTNEIAQIENAEPENSTNTESTVVEPVEPREEVKNETQEVAETQEQVAQVTTGVQKSVTTETPTESITENTNQFERIASISLERTTGISNATSDPTAAPVTFSGQKVAVAKPNISEAPKKGINLKKVLDLAKDLKTDNESWGTLREAKNELLSLGKKKIVESSDD